MTPAALDAALAQLTLDEGFRARPYRDTTGHLTVGYGTNLDAGITPAQGEALVRCALADLQPALLLALPWTYRLNDVRFGVLLQLGYNLGLAGLLGFHQMLAHAQAGEWAAASLQLKASVADQQEPARMARWAESLVTGVQT